MKRTLVNIKDIIWQPKPSAIPYEKKLESYGLRIRWIQGQCFEIKLPDGKYLITDPWFSDIAQKEIFMTGEELEGCDYVFVNHAHLDHFQALPEIFKRFQPMIICDAEFARELSYVFKIDAGYFFPVVSGQNYMFDSFRLETYHGMHNFLVGSYSDIYDDGGKDEKNGKGFGALSSYGCLINTNWMMRLPNNLRLGFAAGVDNENQAEAWRLNGPNITLHQRMCYTTAEEYADEICMLGGQIVIPMHHDASYAYNADMNVFCEEVNRILAERGSTARVMNLERNKWYTIGTQIVAD